MSGAGVRGQALGKGEPSHCCTSYVTSFLVFVVKTCDIADASRGSLSSYAYTLLTIAFLQREGILPVLQVSH